MSHHMITVVPCHDDPDDDHAQITINGYKVGPPLWPSEAITVAGWLEKAMVPQPKPEEGTPSGPWISLLHWISAASKE